MNRRYKIEDDKDDESRRRKKKRSLRMREEGRSKWGRKWYRIQTFSPHCRFLALSVFVGSSSVFHQITIYFSLSPSLPPSLPPSPYLPPSLAPPPSSHFVFPSFFFFSSVDLQPTLVIANIVKEGIQALLLQFMTSRKTTVVFLLSRHKTPSIDSQTNPTRSIYVLCVSVSELLPKKTFYKRIIRAYTTLPYLTLSFYFTLVRRTTCLNLLYFTSPYFNTLKFDLAYTDFFILPYFTLPYLTIPFRTFLYSTLLCLTLGLSDFTVPYLLSNIIYLTSPNHAVPYLTLNWITLPFPTSPYGSYLTLTCFDLLSNSVCWCHSGQTIYASLSTWLLVSLVH